MNAINRAEEGDFEGARDESDRFSELAAEVGDPLRIWQAQGLRGMFLLNEGKFEEAEKLALETLQFADLHDLPQGISSYVGQRVYTLDLLDRLHELLPQLEILRLERRDLGRRFRRQ